MISTQTPVSNSTDNARRVQRINLSLPARIQYKIDNENVWSEVTRLKDISAFGAGFIVPRPVKRGRIIYLTIPLPRQLRCFDFMEPQYNVYGLVRTCVPIQKQGSTIEGYAVGTAFIGKEPPKSYLDNPSNLYDISHRDDKGLWQVAKAEANPDESHLPKDQRRHSRYPIPVGMSLEILNTEQEIISSEMTVTENISYGGAAIFTTLDTEIGNFLRVRSEQYGVSIMSVVRGKRVGEDGVSRLHIEFIDRFFPLEGIE